METNPNQKPVISHRVKKLDDGAYALMFNYESSLIDFVHLEARTMMEDIIFPTHHEAEDAAFAFENHYNALYEESLQLVY